MTRKTMPAARPRGSRQKDGPQTNRNRNGTKSHATHYTSSHVRPPSPLRKCPEFIFDFTRHKPFIRLPGAHLQRRLETRSMGRLLQRDLLLITRTGFGCHANHRSYPAQSLTSATNSCPWPLLPAPADTNRTAPTMKFSSGRSEARRARRPGSPFTQAMTVGPTFSSAADESLDHRLRLQDESQPVNSPPRNRRLRD